ncbi:MAG: hypothetical protein J2P53_18715, partial [Bradyrhizobiaceae bacterium]|nr:hypothetical protein [Bradyrhizobiaceae bacterium]
MGKLMTGCVVALVALLGSSSMAAAQHPGRTRLHRHGALHVDVAPAGRLYRQCIDRPTVEHRATGDTVVPWSSCRWAVR